MSEPAQQDGERSGVVRQVVDDQDPPRADARRRRPWPLRASRGRGSRRPSAAAAPRTRCPAAQALAGAPRRSRRAAARDGGPARGRCRGRSPRPGWRVRSRRRAGRTSRTDGGSFAAVDADAVDRARATADRGPFDRLLASAAISSIAPAVRRVLRRVVEQVHEHLGQPHEVAVEVDRPRRQLDRELVAELTRSAAGCSRCALSTTSARVTRSRRSSSRPRLTRERSSRSSIRRVRWFDLPVDDLRRSRAASRIGARSRSMQDARGVADRRDRDCAARARAGRGTRPCAGPPAAAPLRSGWSCAVEASSSAVRSLTRASRLAVQRLELARLAIEVDEDRDLGAQDLGHDRHRQVVHRAARIALHPVDVVGQHGRDQDDRRRAGSADARGSSTRARSRRARACRRRRARPRRRCEQDLERLARRGGLDQVLVQARRESPRRSAASPAGRRPAGC